MRPLELTIEAIDRTSREHTGLTAFMLDSPHASPDPQDPTITIAGWVVPAQGHMPLYIETWAKNRLLKRAKVDVPRPDLTAISYGKPVGFHYEVGTLGLGARFELDTRILLAGESAADRHCVDLFHLRARKQCHLQLRPRYNPLLITASGRSGTTMLMRALGLHPHILTSNFYPYEVRQAGYWLHLLQTCGMPADFAEAAHPDRFFLDRHRSGANPYSHPEYLNQYRTPQAFREYYSHSTFAALSKFCVERIDDYYELIAQEEGKPEARLFAEKFSPGNSQDLCWDIYPGAKEIILTRDFRDMLCSARAFNAKRQKKDFDQDKASNDFEWASYIARTRAQHLHDAWLERGARALHVRYEDLLRNPGEEIRRMLGYLEIDCSNAMSEEIAGAVFAGQDNAGHRTSPDPAASIGRWRAELSPALQEHCSVEFAQVLQTFGYDA